MRGDKQTHGIPKGKGRLSFFRGRVTMGRYTSKYEDTLFVSCYVRINLDITMLKLPRVSI